MEKCWIGNFKKYKKFGKASLKHKASTIGKFKNTIDTTLIQIEKKIILNTLFADA